MPVEARAAPVDLRRLKGQEAPKRALEVAAAGVHHLLLIGPPGASETSLARALPTLFAPFSGGVQEELAGIYRLVGQEPPTSPPLRAPDPGTSRATGGVLLLDELQDFKGPVLASLKEPMTTGRVRLTSSAGETAYPARFLLGAIARPCPCGRKGNRRRECRYTHRAVRRHWRCIPDALFDRIDIHVEVPALELGELRSRCGETGAAVRLTVINARARQARRTGDRWNAELEPEEIAEHASLDHAGRRLFETAFERLGLSARMADSILRVARTVADLAESETVRAPHVAEAIQCRSLDPRTVV